MRTFAISNARNLARALSLGCFGPRAIYGDKYDPDGCELAGGRMPLFAAPPRREVLEAVGDPGALVVVELEVTDQAQTEVVTDAVVPLDAAVRVHFPTPAARQEFLSTPFDNVDPSSITLIDSLPDDLSQPTGGEQPTLLGGDSSGLPSFLHDDVASSLSIATVEEVDRRLGALAELLVPVRWERPWLESLRSMLQHATEGQAPLKLQGIPGIDRQSLSVIEAALVAHPHGETPTTAFIDHVVVDAPEAWPHELERVRAVLRGREAFASTSEWTDPLSAALAVALLRSSPESVREDIAAASPADIGVLRLALWLSGLRRGLARRPVAMRQREIEPVLRTALARTLNGRRGIDFDLPTWSITARVSESEGAHILALEVDGQDAVVARQQLDRRDHLLHGVPPHVLAKWLDVPFTTSVRAPEVTSLAVRDGQIVLTFEGATAQVTYEVNPDDLVAALEDRDESELEEFIRRGEVEDS